MTSFTVGDTMLALIGHQSGMNRWAVTTPRETLERNVLTLAKFAAGVGIPVVLTSSQEPKAQGPLTPTPFGR